MFLTPCLLSVLARELGMEGPERDWWEFSKVPHMFLSFSSFACLGPLYQITVASFLTAFLLLK